MSCDTIDIAAHIEANSRSTSTYANARPHVKRHNRMITKSKVLVLFWVFLRRRRTKSKLPCSMAIANDGNGPTLARTKNPHMLLHGRQVQAIQIVRDLDARKNSVCSKNVSTLSSFFNKSSQLALQRICTRRQICRNVVRHFFARENRIQHADHLCAKSIRNLFSNAFIKSTSRGYFRRAKIRFPQSCRRSSSICTWI